jgi:hypothetical protein
MPNELPGSGFRRIETGDASTYFWMMEFSLRPKELAEIARTLAHQGAEFIGFQDGPRGRLFLFLDVFTRTTLAVRESEASIEAVLHRLQESRNSYGSSAACSANES